MFESMRNKNPARWAFLQKNVTPHVERRGEGWGRGYRQEFGRLPPGFCGKNAIKLNADDWLMILSNGEAFFGGSVDIGADGESATAKIYTD